MEGGFPIWKQDIRSLIHRTDSGNLVGLEALLTDCEKRNPNIYEIATRIGRVWVGDGLGWKVCIQSDPLPRKRQEPAAAFKT